MLKAWEFATPVQGSGSLLLLVKNISRLFFEISLVVVFYGRLLNHKSDKLSFDIRFAANKIHVVKSRY